VRKKEAKARSGLLAALDVGSTKVACLVARAGEGAGGLRVIGIGHQLSRGLRAGAIVDVEEAVAAILATVHAAEKMAGETLHDVVVNISGGHPASQTIGVEVPLNGHEIGDSEVRRVIDHGLQVAEPADRKLIHSIPVGFSIDGNPNIRDPRGMYGQRLGANMHIVTAATGAVRTLMTCVARCHLDIDSLVVSPYASGLACLVEDEMDLGVTVIDMGGGTTTIAVFFDGKAVYTDLVPVGGAHVTNDIARGLSCPLADAERIKALYGSAVSSPLDERETILVPQVGEDRQSQPNRVPKSILVGIIQPRLEETFEMVRARLEASGFDKIAGRRVVLTGGASQLPGLRELAQLILDKQVRMGRPNRMSGLPEATGGPAFATCAGLLTYAQNDKTDAPRQFGRAGDRPSNLLGRFGSWLRENF
jgi:cell division protein FtsA